ncbi:MAG TPA: threo-3-hydroxy-L-aspartate ammonia-lyase [Thermoanaerobaculia bacterium]|nr:threo-3-hydroxy-L-aspartate ammonia-lyase [Thermoanaerobaculia bacterium]
MVTDPDLPASYADVEAAARRLEGVVHRTPVVTSRTLDARVGARVLLKCENLQRTGSFKMRGAYNALSLHRECHPGAGVATFSSGNHAQAMSLSGSLLGVPTVIVMPGDAPRVKLDATRDYGGEVVLYDREETTREEVAAQLARERGLTVIPAYDHADVIAGQGTVARELIEDAAPLDLLLVCLGGGGLLSGSALAARALAPGCRIVGVEPELADDGARSFRTGVLHHVHNPPTIADGARTPCLGELTFPLIRALVDDVVTVSEEAIVESMRFLWERVKLVVEPTGALALAGLLSGVVAARPGARVGVTITGGNVDLAFAARLLGGERAAPS